MRVLCVEPHYLGSLEFFACLLDCEEIELEVHQHFQKQTFKNRCHFLAADGVKTLSIPVQFGNRTPLKDVKIDHSQSWVREHWGAFYSVYGKAPFFEHFADYFHGVWERKHQFLLDLNVEMMTLCLRILQIDRNFRESQAYELQKEEGINDMRELILPKKPFDMRNLYRAEPYMQVFGSNFVPNLSIVDLLMCEGSNSLNILRKSLISH